MESLKNENVCPAYQSVLRIIAGSTILYYGSVLFVDNGAIPLVELVSQADVAFLSS